MSERSISPENIQSNKDLKLVEQKNKNESSVNSILDTPLTVENINTYANDAINKLVEFSYKKVIEYKQNNQTSGLSGKEIEDNAFKYCGLNNISFILNQISIKDEEIRDINKIISNPMMVNKVITPPDFVSNNLSSLKNGEDKFKEKTIIDRTKTILFVLKEDFDVDIYNQAELTITKGIINENMMRKTSYFLLDVPKIDRLILVCDEDGNASYVFNSLNLEKYNITKEDILSSTKNELNKLIEENIEIGKRVNYSKEKFVLRISETIKNPISSIKDEPLNISPRSESYLYPKAPEGFLSLRGVSIKSEINKITLKKII